MSGDIVELSLGRVGLILGLNALGAKPGQEILIPDYCCDVLYHPVLELGLIVKTYKVLDDLSPDWGYLNRINTSNVFGIIMIHYFGQPQNIEMYKTYCSEKNVYLIEDNAHGYGGFYKGQLMGTFGDIGISSPRKVLGLPQGGILYSKDHLSKIDIRKSFKKVPSRTVILNFIKFLVYLCRPLYKYLAKRKLNKYNFSDPYAFKESIQPHRKASVYVKWYLNNVNMDDVAISRRNLWYEWHDYLSRKGLRPVFNDISENSCPWAIAFYTNDMTDRNLWISWGLSKDIPVFCWPCLPDEEIQLNGTAKKRWEKMFCVILNSPPPNP